MDRKSLAQELRRWVVEEMGLPQQKAPSEEMLQRLFIGQCADIWKYIIRHVRSQRTVKNIEGNLLWYRQLQHCEALRSIEVEEYHRRKHLCQEIQEVRSELQQIHEQIQCAEKEISSRDLNNQKSHDYRLRALMLRAFQRKRAQEWDSLQDTSLRLKHRCDKLRDITRASQCQIVFPDLEPTPAKIPEPVVLRDTRQAYDLRYTFLRTLYEDAVCGITQSINSPNYLAISHQQWISMSEKLWWAHPPFHIFSSLQHITIESTQELQQQQSLLTIDKPDVTINYDARADGTDDNREERKHGRYFRTCFDRPDLNSDEFELPTISSLFKDGWSQSVAVMSKIHSLDSQSKDASAHLAKRIKAIHQSLADGSESSALKRAAFDAELRLVMLRGQRDALLQECRDLEQEAEDLKEDVNFLENEQKDIEDTCSILNKKQHQIQILINNNAVSESRIRYSASEMQKYVLEKLSPMPQEIVQESQRLQDAIMKDVRHFCNVYLPALQKVSTGGNRLIPAQELSINRLSNPHFPYYPVYKKIYASVGLSLYKAPETLLPHVAEMKKQLLFLNSQLRSRTRAIARIMEQLHESQNPDIDALLQRLSSHYKEQTEELVPKLQRLIEQCQKSQEYGKEVQATVTDWWEQPAQLCLPWEERGGQTLRQWRDRWTVAVTALQRASGAKS